MIGIGSSGGNAASSAAVINNSVNVQAKNDRSAKNALAQFDDLNISNDIADPGYENMDDDEPRLLALSDSILILLIAALMYVVFVNHRRIFYSKK